MRSKSVFRGTAHWSSNPFIRAAGSSALLLAIGCSDAKQALVVNGSSDNVSSVTVSTGAVESPWGSVAAGPLGNRVVVSGAKAYIVSSGGFPGSANASVRVVDIATKTVLNTIPLPDGTNPMAIAVVSETKAYVTLFYGEEVTILDPTQPGAAAVIGHIALPSLDGGPTSPSNIALSGGRAYVANAAFDANTFGYGPGSMSVIDVATDTVIDADGDGSNGAATPVALGCTNSGDLDVDGAGQVHVLCTGDYFSVFGEVKVVSASTLSVVRTVALGGSPGSITVAGLVALVSDGAPGGCKLYAVRTDSGAVIHDDGSPLTLLATAGYCSSGKGAATPSGLYAYVPAGSYGAEAALAEVYVVPSGASAQVSVTRTFDLAPAANLPASVGLLPY